MALSDKWSLSTLRTAARRELGDPNGLFWPDAELNLYINDWQNELQSTFEFVWGTTTTTATATITLLAVAPTMLRVDAIYFKHGTSTSVNRIVPRSKTDLDAIKRAWRQDIAQDTPLVVYQDDQDTVSFWPAPTASGTLFLEYPTQLTLTSSTDTMGIPAWTRYSCKDYVGFRAFSRFGATQNQLKAARYKTKFDRQVKLFQKFYDNYMPENAAMLRPGGKFAADILNPRSIFLK